ncbi:MAG: GTPase [Promethearchaeota archaeon]
MKDRDEPVERVIERLLGRSGIHPSPEKIKTKILLIGPPGSGKSTVRSVFFEEIEPRELFQNTLEPTRGVENYVYDWFGVEVGVADSSGQEILDWFEEGKREEVFGYSDAIIFLFDASRWEASKEEVQMYLYKTYLTAFLLELDAPIHVFFHKADLVPPERQDHLFATMKTSIHQHLVENDLTVAEVNCRWTSVVDAGVFTIFRAFRSILMAAVKKILTSISEVIPSPTRLVKKRVREIAGKVGKN